MTAVVRTAKAVLPERGKTAKVHDVSGFIWGDTMRPSRRHILLGATGSVILSSVARSAWAQIYPSRPITMIVPFAPGGTADPVGRLFAERMRNSLGQPVVVENVTGANGSIGTARVAKAAGDGYTIGIGFWNTHVANAALQKLQYDVVSDFVPIALVATYPLVVVAKKTIPANNLNELIAWLKANPGKAAQGSPGAGSQGHLIGAYFQKMTGTSFQHVPYRGSVPAMQDLIAEHIDLMIDTPAVVLPHIRAGNIKAFAVTRARRLDGAPGLPTVDEAGLPELHASNWSAFFAPKGTPKSIIALLNAAVVEALSDQTVRQKIIDFGFDIPSRDEQSPEALEAFQKAEIAKWTPIIQGVGIKIE